MVGAALVFIYYDSHRSAAAKLQDQDNREDDRPLDIEMEIRRIQAVIQAGIVGDNFVACSKTYINYSNLRYIKVYTRL
mgnify:CR=1 FL=1